MVTIALCGLLLLVLPTITNAQYRDGDLRLIGGSYPWEGRVEIYFSGTWGTITDSDWTSDDAQAVCRKLGYFKPGASLKTGAYFGSGSGPIHLDYVVCSGTEYNLTDCQTGNRTRQSNHSEDVGVKCQTINSSYRNGSMRLVGGNYNWEGRVEIFYSGTWTTISDTSWTSSDATVVCRQLQHSIEGAVPYCCGYYGKGSGPILVCQVSCSGSEENITLCPNLTSIVHDHQYDVGVQCQQGSQIYHEGDIRLVGGSYSWEGRVEIYLYGEWGTITHDYTDVLDAHVVCRQLGYDTRYGYTDVSLYHARFGEGSGPIHMNYLRCTGTEHKLIDCNYQFSTDQHYEDWSVTCANDFPSNGEVRLYYNYGTPSYYGGLVEVYISGEWGTVANDGTWSRNDGEVVCRQLGFKIPSTSIYLSNRYYSTSYREPTPVHMSNVQCLGNESRLTDCPHSSGGSGSGATLECYPYNSEECSTGQLRLVGGDTEMEGRVELCTSYYRWGTVCNKQWTPSHTRVVCRQLGYSDIEGTYQAPYTFNFNGPMIPLLMDYINCSGSEVRLWNCLHFTHSYSGCSHADDAGVSCQPVQCDDGDIRLLTGEIMGPLEVCVSKRWATVCSYGWSNVDAIVACREMGFDSGTTHYFHYLRRSLQIAYVSCSGTESRFSDCGYTTYEYNYCSNTNTGVTCNPADCADGELRLMEGDFEGDGRVEVCLGQRWGTVASDRWTEFNSQVVCRELGYAVPDTGEDIYPPRTAPYSMPMHINYVQCTGEEIQLLDCSYSRNHTDADRSKDFGIKCRIVSCADGDLRLLGGESKSNGVLEVCFSQRWGTINGDGWTSSDTQVACRQLGFEGDSDSYERKGILAAPIFMDNVACYGSEDKLIDCTYHTDTTEDDHSNDIWINCNVTGTSKTATFDIISPSAKTVTDESTNITPIIGLGVAFLGLSITILVIIFLIGYIVCRCKSKPHTISTVRYQSDDEGGTARVITNQTVREQKNTSSKAVGKTKPDMPYALIDTGKMEPPSNYQQCTMRKKSDYKPAKITKGKKEQGVAKSGGLGSQPGQISLDGQIYDTVTINT